MNTIQKLALAAITLLASGCLLGEEDDNGNESGQTVVTDAPEQIFVFTSDYTSGELHRFSLEDTTLSDGISFHQDSRLRSNGENLWILEGLGVDNLVKLPLDYQSADDVALERSLPEESNPVDMEFIGKKAWVSLENTNKLIQIDIETGTTSKSVDLSKFAFDENNKANSGDLMLSNDTLFVLIQSRNGWDPGKKGTLLLLDANNGETLKEITLPFKNPTSIVKADDKVLVSISGGYFVEADSTRGVVLVDLASGDSEVLMTDLDLEGEPKELFTNDQGVFIRINKGYDDSWNSVDEFGRIDLNNNSVSLVKDLMLDGGIGYSTEYETWIMGHREPGKEGLTFIKGNSITSFSVSDILAPYSVLVTP